MGRKIRARNTEDAEDNELHLDLDLDAAMPSAEEATEEFVLGGRRPDDGKPRPPSFRLGSMFYSHKEEGHDVDDGENADSDEELEAIETDQRIQSTLKDTDFLLPGMDTLVGPVPKPPSKAAKAKLFSEDNAALETVDKDFKAATDEQKLKLLARDSPELVHLLGEYKQHMHTVKAVLAPLLSKVKAGELPTSAGMSFLQMKFHVLLLYCMHIVFYMTLKVEGKPVKDHPVIDRLVELRVYLQRLAPLEKKLKYNIERLLAASNLRAEGAELAEGEEILLRPRLENLVPVEPERGGEAEEGEPRLYQAPRAMTSLEDEVAKRKKLRRTAKQLAADIEAYEDANYTMYNPTKAEKKLLKSAEQDDNFKMRDHLQKEEAFEGEEEVDDEDLTLLQFLDRKRRAITRLKQREEEDLAQHSRKVLEGGAAFAADEEITSGDEEESEAPSDAEKDGGPEGEDPFYRQERLKEEARRAKAEEKRKGALTRPREEEEGEGPEAKRRAAGKKILKNRGLTPGSRKKKPIPRTAMKKAFEKQTANRKRGVKEYAGTQYNTYKGESRISDHVIRGVKLS